MKNIDIIEKLIKSGPFNYNGYRYLLDFDGFDWEVKKIRLFTDGGYDARTAETVCTFSF